MYAPLGELIPTPVNDPKHGRAGGYVGADRVTVLESGTIQSSNTTVKTSESDIGHIAQVSVPARPGEAQAAQEGGRQSEDRFSKPQGAQGQDGTVE